MDEHSLKPASEDGAVDRAVDDNPLDECLVQRAIVGPVAKSDVWRSGGFS